LGGKKEKVKDLKKRENKKQRVPGEYIRGREGVTKHKEKKKE